MPSSDFFIIHFFQSCPNQLKKIVLGSDWLIDWEINGQVDRVYQELLDKNLTVFMERDQLDTQKADAYDRAGYGVPQRVRKNWKIVDETPHFVVFQRPL